jgi:hypothetical protein
LANQFSTGPVDLYIAPGTGVSTSGYGGGFTDLLTYPSAGGMYFLGSCEKAPQVLINPKWMPHLSDLNGGMIPFDVSCAIADAQVTMTLTRWNESVYKFYTTNPIYSGTRGSWAAADVGRLMLHEARAACLWCYFPYSSLKEYGGSYNQPGGYRFIATWPTAESVMSGSTLSKRMLQVYASPVYNPANGNWKLYDDTMTYIPSLPPYNTTGIIT